MLRNDLSEEEIKEYLMSIGVTLAKLGKTSVDVTAPNGALAHFEINVKTTIESNVEIIQIPDNKFVALMSMQHGKTDKIIIANSYKELIEETHQKDMVSMIHYMDEKPKPTKEE